MCGMEGHVADSRKSWTQSARRRNQKSSTAVVSDFILWFCLIKQNITSLFRDSQQFGPIIFIWTLMLFLFLWLFSWFLGSSNNDPFTLLVFVGSRYMASKFPSIIKLLSTYFASIQLSINRFCEKVCTFLLEIIGEFHSDSSRFRYQLLAEFLIDLIGENDDGVEFVENFFLKNEMIHWKYIWYDLASLQIYNQTSIINA